ncbi:MAG: hypothetical protein V1913_13130 [Fibrobacterota bacterium]
MAARFCALILLPLFFAAPFPATADTLNVIGILMEFQKDELNDLTTGDGTFGTCGDYRLDNRPGGGNYRAYFEKHLAFAKNYFERASNGRLVINYAIADTVLPGGDPTRRHLYVGHRMRHYRVPEKRPAESIDEYNYRLNQGIMAFAGDALRRAAEAGLLDTGFTSTCRSCSTVTPVRVQKSKTVVVVFHAGASGLTDGAGMGGLFATTPSDLIDSYIWPSDFKDYNGTAYNDNDGDFTLAYDRSPADGSYGIFSKDSSNFVQQLLIVSETASQDGLNFGVNGILVNQLARAMGLPDLWDTQKGVSAVGAFCLMDVGGYNTVRGFAPILPSAWCRVKLGWADPIVAVPGVAGWSDTLHSVLTGNSGNTVIKVPLSSTEYYLIENRQYMASTLDSFTLTTDADTFSYDPYDTLYGAWGRMVFDSLCANPDDCRQLVVNPKKAAGVVTDCNSPDVGLPGFGVLVWHIDEQVLSEKLALNGVNNYINRRGVDLEESDGIEDLGAEFVDIFGQATQSYGGPADFFPHYEFKSGQYISQITPYRSGTPNSHTDRFFSTHTNTGGYTGITISIDTIADSTKLHEYINEWNERVRLFSADVFRVRVDWMRPQGNWPRRVDTLNSVKEAVCVNSVLYAVTPTGNLMAWAANGDTLAIVNALGDTVRHVDSTLRIAGHRRLSTPSVADSFLYFTSVDTAQPSSRFFQKYDTRTGTYAMLDSLAGDSLSTLISILHDTLYCGTFSGKIAARAVGFDTAVTLALGKPITALALDSMRLFAVAGGTLYKLNRRTLRVLDSRLLSMLSGEVRMAVGDVARSNAGLEIALNDANGNVVLLDSLLNVLPGWPVKVDANRAVSPSLGDVDGDGNLDIVIPGNNKIFALNYSGTPLTGWPYTLSIREPSGAFIATATLTDLDNDNAMELFIPAPNGNLLVLDNDAQVYDFAPGARVAGLSLPFGGASGFSCVAANLDKDSSAGVPEHLEVFTENAEGWLACFNVALGGPENTVWATNGGSLARTFAYPAALPALRGLATGMAVDTLFTYPNPVKGPVVTVKYRLSNSASRVRCKLFNAAGDKVLEKSGWPSGALWNHASLDVGRLAPGLYTLKLEAESAGKTVFRFTKVGVWK